MNKVTLGGQIVRDIRSLTATGDFVGFTVVTTETVNVNDTPTEYKSYHSVVASGKMAREALKNFRSGTRVELQGKLKTRKKDDKYYTSVVMDSYKITNIDTATNQAIGEAISDDYFPSLAELHAPVKSVQIVEDEIPF